MHDVFKHSGIKNMHWGERRFQYKDGSLTPEGKIRYGHSGSSKSKISNTKERSIKKKLSDYSDDEINKAIDRMNLERKYIETYTSLENAKKAGQSQSQGNNINNSVESGKKFVSDLMTNSAKDLIKMSGKSTTQAIAAAFDQYIHSKISKGIISNNNQYSQSYIRKFTIQQQQRNQNNNKKNNKNKNEGK